MAKEQVELNLPGNQVLSPFGVQPSSEIVVYNGNFPDDPDRPVEEKSPGWDNIPLGPDIISTIPPLPSRLNTVEIKQEHMHFTDGRVLKDLRSLGYTIHTVSSKGKRGSFPVEVSKSIKTPTKPYEVDQRISAQLRAQGYALAGKYNQLVQRYYPGSQGGGLRGQINLYPDLGALISTNMDPQALQDVGAKYLELKFDASKPEDFTNMPIDLTILQIAIESRIGQKNMKPSEVTVAKLCCIDNPNRELLYYVPDSNIVLGANFQQNRYFEGSRRSHTAMRFNDVLLNLFTDSNSA